MGGTEGEQLCCRCPVRDECLDFGGDAPYGIWGGTTQTERRRKSSKPRQARGDQTGDDEEQPQHKASAEYEHEQA